MTDAQRRAYLLIAVIWLSTFVLVTMHGQSAIDGVRKFAQTARYNIHHAINQRYNLRSK